MRLIIGLTGLALLFLSRRLNKDDIRNNHYFPVQSSSERVAGHPIVGVS